WQVSGPLPSAAREPLISQIAASGDVTQSRPGIVPTWQIRLATGTESPLRLDAGNEANPDTTWLAFTEIDLPEPTAGGVPVTGSGPLRIWLNGRLIHRGGGSTTPAPASSSIVATLARGPNRLMVEVAAGRTTEFHLRFRRRSSRVEHERLMRAALTGSGDAAR